MDELKKPIQELKKEEIIEREEKVHENDYISPERDIKEAAIDKIGKVEDTEEVEELIEENGETDEIENGEVGIAKTDTSSELLLTSNGGFAFERMQREEVRSIVEYMDQLLDELPQSKIEEFANSQYLKYTDGSLRS